MIHGTCCKPTTGRVKGERKSGRIAPIGGLNPCVFEELYPKAPHAAASARMRDRRLQNAKFNNLKRRGLYRASRGALAMSVAGPAVDQIPRIATNPPEIVVGFGSIEITGIKR
jgi:hypothetical protein